MAKLKQQCTQIYRFYTTIQKVLYLYMQEELGGALSGAVATILGVQTDLISIPTEDILNTVILAMIGSVVGAVTTLLFKRLFKRMFKKDFKD